MSKKLKISEVQIAATMVELLKLEGWDVYQEVQMFAGNIRADIVAVRDFGQTKIVRVVEAKLHDGLEVLAQAYRWLAFAHYVDTIVPYQGHRKKNPMVNLLYRQFGIGRYEISGVPERLTIEAESMRARLNRVDVNLLLNSLTEGHKNCAVAGSNHGGFYTNYAGSERQLVEYVQKHPGCSIREAVASINHHWSNDQCARQCVAKGLLMGWIQKIRTERQGKSIILFPLESEKP